MKRNSVAQGLPEMPNECGRCGSRYDVRYIAIAKSHYSFSGYVCERCEPALDYETGELIKT